MLMPNHRPLACGCEYCVSQRLADGGESRFTPIAWLAAVAWLAIFAFSATFWFALFWVFIGT